MNKNLANNIKRWKEFEQKLRFQAGKDFAKNHKTGVYNYMVYLIDAINNLRIKEIIKECGYPTQKLLGKTGLKDFWLLVQHQDEDLKLQQECLANCAFAPVEKAYLMDRVLLAEGKKQLYATQFVIKDGRRVLRPLKNIKNVNKLRKLAGMESLESYLKKADRYIKPAMQGKTLQGLRSRR